MERLKEFKKDYTVLNDYLKRTHNSPFFYEFLKTAFDFGYNQGFENGWKIANILNHIAEECGEDSGEDSGEDAGSVAELDAEDKEKYYILTVG